MFLSSTATHSVRRTAKEDRGREERRRERRELTILSYSTYLYGYFFSINVRFVVLVLLDQLRHVSSSSLILFAASHGNSIQCWDSERLQISVRLVGVEVSLPLMREYFSQMLMEISNALLPIATRNSVSSSPLTMPIESIRWTTELFTPFGNTCNRSTPICSYASIGPKKKNWRINSFRRTRKWVSFVFFSVCRADSDAARYIALLCFSVLLSLPRCFNGQRKGEQKIPLALCALGECLASPFIAVLFIFLLNTVTWRSKRTRFERSDRVEIGERESGWKQH